MEDSAAAMPKAGSSALPLSRTTEHDPSDLFNKKQDQDYDYDVRELVLDRRARPKDRTKTEEELALEAKEALEKAERKRLKRMVGDSDASTDEDEVGKRGTNRRAKGQRGGDELPYSARDAVSAACCSDAQSMLDQKAQ